MRVLQAVDPEGGQYEQDRARSAVRIASVMRYQSQAASECKAQREKLEGGENARKEGVADEERARDQAFERRTGCRRGNLGERDRRRRAVRIKTNLVSARIPKVSSPSE